MMNVNEFKVDKAPATTYYIPNFVSKEEEQQLLDKVYKVPKPKWTQLSNRRLQNWGGVPHPNGMLVELIPEWLSLYLDKVWQLGIFKDSCKPNHVLVNEYLAGQGIMPHSDGPLFYPTITTLSLGSHTVLDFYLPRSDSCGDSSNTNALRSLSLLVEPRSLLILQDDMYSTYLHGIEERNIDILSNSVIPNSYACEMLKNGYGIGSCLQKENTDFFKRKGNFFNEELIASEELDNNMLEQERNLIPVEDFVLKAGEKSREALNMYETKLSHSEENLSGENCDKVAQERVHKLQRGTRVSLTMRHVPKTSKVKIKLGK